MNRKSSLFAAASVVVLMMSGVATAQTTRNNASDADANTVQEVVVTGSNIRGVAPVGQNVIAIGRQQINETAATSMGDLLTLTAPQVNGFGSSNQSSGNYAPSIRGLGGYASASTLVLVDGHRISPGTNAFNTQSDPNIVPTGAVERVDILPDGASAIYGSDAVAGVINVITRKNYNGFELSGQDTVGDHYNSSGADAVLGHAWGSGSFIASFDYTRASDLRANARSFVSGNQSNTGVGANFKGGQNANTFVCSPTTVTPLSGQPGAGLVYSYPYGAGTGIANTPAVNGLCSTAREGDLLPATTSSRIYLALHQDLTERIKFSGNLIYSQQDSKTVAGPGTARNVTVYGPGSSPPGGAGQINPFFQGPPGVTTEQINFDFLQLIGGTSLSVTQLRSLTATAAVDIDLGHDWSSSLAYTYGSPTSRTVGGSNAVCAACVNLALNGTVSATGSPTAPSVVGTKIPLTTANALDVWNLTNNRTSAATIAGLLDASTFSTNASPIQDILFTATGPLFKLPAGQVKMAGGGEYYQIGRTTNSTSGGPAGPASLNSIVSYFDAPVRTVISGFIEFNVPAISEDMKIPFVRELTFDIAGRVDRYSDIASGRNTPLDPKFGVTWKPTEDLKLRSSYGTSFTAPLVGSTVVDDGSGFYQGVYGANSGNTILLPAGFVAGNGVPSTAIGCPVTGVCTLTSGSKINGLIVYDDGGPQLAPQTGSNFSLGGDYTPSFAPGLKLSVTYWKAAYRGVITNNITPSTAAVTPGEQFLFTFNPTASQIAAAIAGHPLSNTTGANSPPSTPISFIFDERNYNLFNVRGDGIDLDFAYRLPTGLGTFTYTANIEYKFNWYAQTASGPWTPFTNVGNLTKTFAPLALTGTTSIGWREGSWNANLTANYINSYYMIDSFYSNGSCPKGLQANDVGCQHVSPYLTLGASASYTAQGDGLLKGVQIGVTLRNMLDVIPPFIDSTTGYSTSPSSTQSSNPIGRTVALSIRKRF